MAFPPMTNASAGLPSSEPMTMILRFLNTVDLGGLFVLSAALLMIGNKMSRGYPRVRAFCVSLAGLLFVAYVLFHFLQGTVSSDPLPEVTFRGLVGAGFALGTCWIVLPPFAALYLSIMNTLGRWKAGVWRGHERCRRSLQERRDRRSSGEISAAFAQDRDKARKKAEEQARILDDAQTRRETARAACEVLYALHSFELRERFTRDMFDAFTARHLGDDKTPEYVEKLARELSDIIQKHLEKAEGRAKKGLAELALWFLNEKQQIDATILPAGDKESLIAQLEERYVKLQEKYLRSVQP